MLNVGVDTLGGDWALGVRRGGAGLGTHHVLVPGPRPTILSN